MPDACAATGASAGFFFATGFLDMVVVSVAGMQHGEGFRYFPAEIECSQRRQIILRRRLRLSFLPVRAAGVLDDRIADFLKTLARVDDDRGAAAEPEEVVALVHT